MHKRDDIDDLLDELESDLGLPTKQPPSKPTQTAHTTPVRATTTTTNSLIPNGTPSIAAKTKRGDEIDGLLEELDFLEDPKPIPITKVTNTSVAQIHHRDSSSSSSTARKEKCNPICLGGSRDTVGLSSMVKKRYFLHSRRGLCPVVSFGPNSSTQAGVIDSVVSNATSSV
jgi:hypothetical protein